MALEFALTVWARTGEPFAREMAVRAFRAMARGGLYDQIGGGFARYSTDARWLVPHFEKMLYDNALLVGLGVHLWQATGDAEIRRVTEEALGWVVREMTAPEGGFYSTLDADSDGEEGRFYTWTPEEIDAAAGADGPLVRAHFGVTAGGNFEGRSILHVPGPADAPSGGAVTPETAAAIARARPLLYAARAERVWPARDDKILGAWNGLMLRACCLAARAFDSPRWRELALANATFLFGEMVRDDRARRSHRQGVTRPGGYLEDQSAVALAALSLYELTFDRAWLDRARAMGAAMVRWFWDEDTGAFFDTPTDHERLITRPRDVSDNATPSGTSLAVELSLRLAELTGDEAHRARAVRVLASLAEPMARFPLGFGHLLGAADLALHGAVEVVITGDPASPGFRALADAVNVRFVPALVLAGGSAAAQEDLPLFAGRGGAGDRAYLCRGYVCDAPAHDAGALAAQLDALIPAGGAARRAATAGRF